MIANQVSLIIFDELWSKVSLWDVVSTNCILSYNKFLCKQKARCSYKHVHVNVGYTKKIFLIFIGRLYVVSTGNIFILRVV